LTVVNPIPNTLLSGRWEVIPHPNDPPHTSYDHAWIAFDPMKFEGNNIECKITVDTSQLHADRTYSRQIRLQTNADVESSVVTLNVRTPSLAYLENKLSLASVPRFAFMFLFALAGWLLIDVQQNNNNPIWVWIIVFSAVPALSLLESMNLPDRFDNFHRTLYGDRLLRFIVRAIAGSIIFGLLGAAFHVTSQLIGIQVGAIIGVLSSADFHARSPSIKADQPYIRKRFDKFISIALISILVIGVIAMVCSFFDIFSFNFFESITPFLVKYIIPSFFFLFTIAVFFAIFYVPSYLYIFGFKVLSMPLVEGQSKRGFTKSEISQVLLLVSTFSLCLGMVARLGTWSLLSSPNSQPLNGYIVVTIAASALAATGIPLLKLILQPYQKIALYRRYKSQLIES
jgi:hypothetical protein